MHKSTVLRKISTSKVWYKISRRLFFWESEPTIYHKDKNTVIAMVAVAWQRRRPRKQPMQTVEAQQSTIKK